MCLLLSGAKIIELTGQGNEQSLKGLLYAATVVAKNKVQLIGFGSFEACERTAVQAEPTGR